MKSKPKPVDDGQKVPLGYARPGTANRADVPQRRKRLAVVGMWIGLRVAYWVVILGLVVLAVMKFKKMVGMYEGFMRR